MEERQQEAVLNLLRQHWVEARQRHPQYSLRAFAKRLQVSPSTLSELLRGIRPVTRKQAEKLARLLALSPSQKEELFGEAQGSLPPLAYQGLAQDQFELVSDWVHFAVLSLTETKDFVASPEWIAERLGISLTRADRAWERLRRLGLLVRRRGKWESAAPRYESPDEIRLPALQNAHAQHFELARKSLQELELEVRDFTGITMAIDPSKLKQAKKKIREFRDEISKFLESGEKQEVYQLAVQLFPLSKKASGRKNEE